jgi:quercetin dioxygenase-like cupin family protein
MSAGEGPQATIVRAGDAETLRFPAQMIQLLADNSQTGGAVSFIRSTLARGADGARPHHHKTTTEIFYVLDGSLDILAGDQVITVGKGDLATVPPGMMHAFAAPASDIAEMLIIVAPAVERFDYFRLLQRVVTGSAQIADVLAAQEQFDNWFSGSDAWSEYHAAKAP